MRTHSLVLALVALAAVPARAQHEHPAQEPSSAAAGDAAIRALSGDEIAGLLEGQGMGLARAAELNGYPGPLHVLELADSLALRAEQRATAERLRAGMLVEARALGAEIVAREAALDAAFAQGRATASLVDSITAEIGGLQGRLRAVHLRTHVIMRAALTDIQAARYAHLRGSREPR